MERRKAGFLMSRSCASALSINLHLYLALLLAHPCQDIMGICSFVSTIIWTVLFCGFTCCLFVCLNTVFKGMQRGQGWIFRVCPSCSCPAINRDSNSFVISVRPSTNFAKGNRSDWGGGRGKIKVAELGNLSRLRRWSLKCGTFCDAF